MFYFKRFVSQLLEVSVTGPIIGVSELSPSYLPNGFDPMNVCLLHLNPKRRKSTYFIFIQNTPLERRHFDLSRAMRAFLISFQIKKLCTIL